MFFKNLSVAMICVVGFILAALLVLPSRVNANSSEYKLKTAFIFNLARMISWPEEIEAEKQREFQLCFFGKDDFGSTLDLLAGKKVRGHQLQLRRDIGLTDLDDCQLVFISESARRQLANILYRTSGRPILTVADTPGFSERGVIVNLLKQETRINIEINRCQAQKNRLEIDAKLLELATIYNNC